MAPNADIVRESFAAWNRNDWDALEAAYDPEVVVHPPDGWPEAEPAVGWPALRETFESLKSAWAEEGVEPTDITESGDRVFARFNWVARGRSSGVATGTPFYGVFTLRDGKITRLRYFLTRELAEAALHEREPAVQPENPSSG